MTFAWEGQQLPLFDHPYNHTWENERAVEMSVARAFRAQHGYGAGLEVGNVLSHYGDIAHDVIDLYEHAPGVRNIDIFDVTGGWDWIISVSTIEHIQWDTEPRTATGATDAIAHMLALLNAGGSMLVTAPIGWHPHLDDAIYSRRVEPNYSNSLFYNHDGHWTLAPDWNKAWRPYDWAMPSARAVWIGTWRA